MYKVLDKTGLEHLWVKLKAYFTSSSDFLAHRDDSVKHITSAEREKWNINVVVPDFGTTANTICEGDDYRLSNARPASDVSPWAKSSTKPSYVKSEVGLGNVDNTSDMAKPISTLTQNALNDKLDKNASAASAAKLTTINTTFNGRYPMTVNVNGVIYSHTDVTFEGSTGTLSTPKMKVSNWSIEEDSDGSLSFLYNE